MADNGEWRTTKHATRMITVVVMAGLLLGMLILFALMGEWEGFWFMMVFVPVLCLGAYLLVRMDERKTWNMVYKDFGTDFERVSEGITRALTDRGTGFSRRDVRRFRSGGKVEETLVLDEEGLEIMVHHMGFIRVFIGPVTEFNRTEVDVCSRLIDEALGGPDGE